MMISTPRLTTDLEGRVLTPEDPAYDEERTVWADNDCLPFFHIGFEWIPNQLTHSRPGLIRILLQLRIKLAHEVL